MFSSPIGLNKRSVVITDGNERESVQNSLYFRTIIRLIKRLEIAHAIFAARMTAFRFMKKLLNSFLILLSFAFAVAAQNAREIEKNIENIRAYYTEISQKIKAAEENEDAARTSDLAINELVINKGGRSWAAVGNYRVTYKFFYQNRAEEPYPTALVKVTRSAEVAARRYFEEFVYDKSGALIFYFEKSEDGEPPEERRVYFSAGKAIRIIEDKTARDKLAPKDAEIVRGILKNSARIKDIFVKSIEN